MMPSLAEGITHGDRIKQEHFGRRVVRTTGWDSPRALRCHRRGARSDPSRVDLHRARAARSSSSPQSTSAWVRE